MATHYIAAIHLSGGTGHEHITQLVWMNGESHKSGINPIADLVAFIEEKKGDLKVSDGTTAVPVGVVHPKQGTPFLRTFKDKQWTDNLLAIPRY